VIRDLDLLGPETAVDDGGSSEVTYLKIGLPSEARILGIEQMLPKDSQWIPVARWRREGGSVLLVYREKRIEAGVVAEYEMKVVRS
jgi:hypothetical protein